MPLSRAAYGIATGGVAACVRRMPMYMYIHVHVYIYYVFLTVCVPTRHDGGRGDVVPHVPTQSHMHVILAVAPRQAREQSQESAESPRAAKCRIGRTATLAPTATLAATLMFCRPFRQINRRRCRNQRGG